MVQKSAKLSTVEVTSYSRVKTWFMVQFKGYTVVQHREIPRVTRLGRLTYDNLWQLQSCGEEKQGASSGKSGAKS